MCRYVNQIKSGHFYLIIPSHPRLPMHECLRPYLIPLHVRNVCIFWVAWGKQVASDLSGHEKNIREDFILWANVDTPLKLWRHDSSRGVYASKCSSGKLTSSWFRVRSMERCGQIHSNQRKYIWDSHEGQHQFFSGSCYDRSRRLRNWYRRSAAIWENR